MILNIDSKKKSESLNCITNDCMDIFTM